jgi:hypothetical protein
MSVQCLSCHKEIARLLKQGRGYHGLHPAECALCHAEHAGRDFRLIDPTFLDPATFDHEVTGYALAERHGLLKCEQCHREELVESGFAALRPGERKERSYLGLARECSACHEDPHKGRLGVGCADCHRETGFRDVNRTAFDHAKTAFPLRGAHSRAECVMCHDAKTAWGPHPPHESCAGCHGEAHGRQLPSAGGGPDCDQCHSEDVFRPSTYTVLRHERTPFPLLGKHAGVPCADCHKRDTGEFGIEWVGKARVVLRARHDGCTDCHIDPHGGEFASRPDGGACGSCHTETGWTPSRYTADDHRATRFPLEGRHRETACATCHPASAVSVPAGGEGPRRLTFRYEDVTCTACHVDPHAGRYAAATEPGGRRACIECHDVQTFRPATTDIDSHRAFAFALEGAHRAVPCADCHPDLKGIPFESSLRGGIAPVRPILFAATHDRCVACHPGPHGPQFSEDCSTCHDSNRFRPASRFDHETDSDFPLTGAHARVACDRCHTVSRSEDGTERVLYRPIPKTCESCHDRTRENGPGTSGEERERPEADAEKK